MSEYIPSPAQWVRDQVELYEGSGGTEGLTHTRAELLLELVQSRAGSRLSSSASLFEHPRFYQLFDLGLRQIQQRARDIPRVLT